MNHVLMAVLLLASTPLLAGQRVASLEPECVRQHTCTPIQNHPRERLATGAECPVGSRVYCGDDLPYCCYAPNSQVYYCAQDIQHCTRD